MQRQYSGTAGRIENSQVGVFLSYASRAGRALIDRRVYLPKSWTDDRLRCAAAGVPAETRFATKPELALEMITGAVAARTPAAWVAADEAYGDNGWRRAHRRPARRNSRHGPRVGAEYHVPLRTHSLRAPVERVIAHIKS
jgi:SRSO17 transposase